MAAVFDTNVLVSAALFAASKPSRAVRHAVANDVILASTATLAELASIMEREKFERYAPLAVRRRFVALICATARIVAIRRSLRLCRDPKDDKFLDVAVNGGADILVSGDADLLVLDAVEGIPIATPAMYLVAQNAS